MHAQRLERIADVVPDLGPESRVMDVGSGTSCLIPHMQQRGVRDILAVDVAEEALAQVLTSAPMEAAPTSPSPARAWRRCHTCSAAERPAAPERGAGFVIRRWQRSMGRP